MSDRRDPHLSRITGGRDGLLVGDALGVPYEFHAAEDPPAVENIDMVPPDGFRRSHPSPSMAQGLIRAPD